MKYLSKKVTYLPSSFTTCASRRRWSSSFLENQEKILQSQFPQSVHWSDSRWKAYLAAGGGDKRRFRYCTDASGIIIYFPSYFRDIQDANIIDPSLQDNVIIQSNFFQHIHHVGCAFNMHSITISGLIPGGQSSSKRQTVFFLPVDLMDKSHKDPDVIDLRVPRHAQYLH